MRSMLTGKTAMQPDWVAARGTNKVSVIVMLAVAGSLALGAMRSTGASSQLKVATGLTEVQQISHVLNRLTYGPRPGDLERVKRMSIASYIEEQLHPERLEDAATEARLAGLLSLRMPIPKLYDKYPEPSMLARELGFRPRDIGAREQQPDARQQILTYYTEHGLKRPQSVLQELQAQKLIRAVSSERQLQEVMTDFWFNHFNVFWGKGADRWFTTALEMHAIRPHALGTFKDLLLATAKSPAMLFYLDNYVSSALDARAPEGKPGSGINENYARELLELHTLGVEGGYTQQDVEEVARCFTGWLSTCSRITRAPPGTWRPSSCADSSATTRRQSWLTAWPLRICRPGETSAPCSARFSRCRSSMRRRRIARRSNRRSSWSSRPFGRWAGIRTVHRPWHNASRRWASHSTRPSHQPAIRIVPRGGSTREPCLNG
ncbi:MAG: DUF1800 family protein [Nitrospinae bacterium]|nr:DUF1800 family protein [Nitrospinota bacterium]